MTTLPRQLYMFKRFIQLRTLESADALSAGQSYGKGGVLKKEGAAIVSGDEGSAKAQCLLWKDTESGVNDENPVKSQGQHKENKQRDHVPETDLSEHGSPCERIFLILPSYRYLAIR